MKFKVMHLALCIYVTYYYIPEETEKINQSVRRQMRKIMTEEPKRDQQLSNGTQGLFEK